MTAQRANQRALAAARIIENLAYALPGYRDELLDRINHTTGWSDHTPGAPPVTEQPTKLLEGRCQGTVSIPGDDYTGPVLMDCGRQRPCPEHDYPVKLTIPEHAAAQREQWRGELADSEQVITTIAMLARELLDRARRTVPIVPAPVPRCDATGLEGYLLPRPPFGDGWSDLACSNPRSRGTLCDACSKRSYRWRAARGLPQHVDGVWSQPAAGAER